MGFVLQARYSNNIREIIETIRGVSVKKLGVGYLYAFYL